MAGPVVHYVPTDPLFDDQGHLQDTPEQRYFPAKDGIKSVWDDYRGNGITIGIIDDGFEYTHPDLVANYDTTIDFDFLDNDDDPLASGNRDFHGTAVAGMIAADDNGEGIVGVAPDSTITGFRIGFGAEASHDVFRAALNAQTNVDISNNSWGFGQFFGDNFLDPEFAGYEEALERGVTEGRDGLGTIWVFASGNGHSYGDYSSYHNMLNSRFTIGVVANGQDSNKGPGVFAIAGTDLPDSMPPTTDRTGAAG